jgi:transcriptional regulator with GAF, ATPase, and Fis domain
LARLFIDRCCTRIGKQPPALTADCLRRLRSYHWPGNVRELENVIERAVIIASDDTLCLRNVLPLENFEPVRESRGVMADRGLRTKRELRELERETIVRALEQAGWKVAGAQGAAQALGVPPSTLASRMKALQIERPKDAHYRPLNSRFADSISAEFPA